MVDVRVDDSFARPIITTRSEDSDIMLAKAVPSVVARAAGRPAISRAAAAVAAPRLLHSTSRASVAKQGVAGDKSK